MELAVRAKSGYNKFLVVWFGEFIASIGSGISSFGLGVFVFQMTNRATDVSMVTLCAFLPAVLLSPIAGVFVDRFDRKLMMILGDSLSAIGLAAMLLIMQFGTIEVWHICLCVALSSVFVSLLDPAYRSMITDMLDKDEYSKASGMVQLASSAKYLISPVIAGFLLGFSDIRLLLAIDIATLLVTVCAVASVRKSETARPKKASGRKFSKDFIDGCAYMVSNKGIMALMLLISVITFYMGTLQTLFTPMILSFSDSKTLGVIESVGASGMLASSLLLGIFSIRKNYVNWIMASLALAGVFVSLAGATTSVTMIAIIAFLFFMMLPFVNTSIEVMMRRTIPNETQGRIWGLMSLLSQIGYIVAYAISGLLADYVFNPMLKDGGSLAASVGRIIGTGPARGIGLQLVISGACMVVYAVVIRKVKSIRNLEKSL